ncbi:helicase, partial [Kouleothrix aurantiaca]
MNQALKQYRALLSTYLQRQRGRVLMLAVLLLGGIALQIANPQILRYFIDSAQGGGATSQLINAAILFIVVAIATQVLNVAATYIAENVGWTATNQLRADLALHTLKLDMSFHKARTPGELIERIDGDVTALANFFSQFVIRVFGSLLLLLGILVALTLANWQIGLMLTGFAVAVVTIITWVQRIAVPYWKIARQTSAELFGFVEERLSGTEDIRSSGAVAYTLGRLAERSRARRRSERRAALIGSGTWFAPILLFAIGTASGYLLAKSLFDSGQITLGTAYLVFFYTQLMYQPIHQLTREIEDLQRATAGIARIQELFATRSSFVDGSTPLPAGALGVEFERVTFAYDDAAGGLGAAAETAQQ